MPKNNIKSLENKDFCLYYFFEYLSEMNTERCQQNASSDKSRITWIRSWDVMRFAVALVLLVAAMLKAYQLATTPTLGEGLLHARWFNIFVVEFEMFFGIWLIFGMLPKATWLVTTCLFVTFLLVTFYEAVRGEESCNCFGNFSLNPWITTVFDVVVIVLLLIFRPYKKQLLDTAVIAIPKLNWLLKTSLITAGLIFVITAQVYLFWGSFTGLNNFININGITFEIDKTFHSQKGDTVKIIITNNLSQSITLVGAKPDCNCGKIENIPILVQPGKSAHIFFVAAENVDSVAKAKQKQKTLFFVDANGIKKYIVELPLFDFLARR